MKISWLGHSCFEIQHKGCSLIIDPYKPGKVPGLKPLDVSADQVWCSHDHDDHNYINAVKLKTVKLHSDVKSDGESAVGSCVEDRMGGHVENPFQMEVIETWHDDCQGSKRGKNKIHIISADGIRIAHFGDLGCRLTDQQVKQLGSLAAVMFPVGGIYTLDALQAKQELDRLNPTVILPMHYRGETFGFPELGELDVFLSLYDKALVKRYKGHDIEILRDNEKQIAVLLPRQA